MAFDSRQFRSEKNTNALHVPCSRCGAVVGQTCGKVDWRGQRIGTRPHTVRLEAAASVKRVEILNKLRKKT